MKLRVFVDLKCMTIITQERENGRGKENFDWYKRRQKKA